MEGPIHHKLKNLGICWLKKKVTDISVCEVKYRNIRSIADVVGINLKRQETRIIEIKASKADFIRDKKLMSLDKSYYKHCDYFYIMCPENVITLKDIPKEYGLIWVDLTNDTITVKRNPTKYKGRLKTMFKTSLKNALRTLNNQYLFHYIIPQNNIDFDKI